MNQFDDRISNFDDGRSGISANTKLGINNQSSKKMGMNSRNNMYDIRPDDIRTEKMNSKQMTNIDNILNEDFDV